MLLVIVVVVVVAILLFVVVKKKTTNLCKHESGIYVNKSAWILEERERKYINTQILCIYVFANLCEFWECSNLHYTHVHIATRPLTRKGTACACAATPCNTLTHLRCQPMQRGMRSDFQQNWMHNRPRSRNTSGKNWHVSPRACRRIWNGRFSLSTLQATHSMT